MLNVHVHTYMDTVLNIRDTHAHFVYVLLPLFLVKILSHTIAHRTCTVNVHSYTARTHQLQKEEEEVAAACVRACVRACDVDMCIWALVQFQENRMRWSHGCNFIRIHKHMCGRMNTSGVCGPA